MDKQDIAPALLGRIRADFLRLLRNAAPSAATYPAALDYADLVGGALAEAFRLHLSADTLPDGRMYWNIADRVLRPLLEEDHALVADAAAAVQLSLIHISCRTPWSLQAKRPSCSTVSASAGTRA